MVFKARGFSQFHWTSKHRKSNVDPYEIERVKILFQYFVVIAFSILFGMLLSRYVSPLLLHERAIKHFSSPFLYCTTAAELFWKFFYYSISDLICIAISFLSAFTVFHYFVSDVILLYQGLTLGFLITTLPKLSPFCHNGELFLLAFFRIWMVICFFIHLYRIALCSYPSRRVQWGTLILFTITASGIIVLSTAIYCGLIYLI